MSSTAGQSHLEQSSSDVADPSAERRANERLNVTTSRGIVAYETECKANTTMAMNRVTVFDAASAVVHGLFSVLCSRFQAID